MIFKNSNGHIMKFDDKVLAALLGYTEPVEVEEFSTDNLSTGIFNLKNRKEIDKDELEIIKTTVSSIIESPHMVNPDLLKNIIATYRFIVECSYRDGEEYKIILVAADEIPEQRVCEEFHWCDMWECKPINSLWYELKEAMELLNLS